MDPHLVIQSQYLATLGMLKQVIVKCPEALWDAPGNQDKFWRKSYHALLYAHLYLQRAEQDFIPWENHHDPDGELPFTKDEVLEYLSFVENRSSAAFLSQILKPRPVFTGFRSTNWNCSFTTSGTSSSTQASSTNDWMHMNIWNLAGFHLAHHKERE